MKTSPESFQILDESKIFKLNNDANDKTKPKTNYCYNHNQSADFPRNISNLNKYIYFLHRESSNIKVKIEKENSYTKNIKKSKNLTFYDTYLCSTNIINFNTQIVNHTQVNSTTQKTNQHLTKMRCHQGYCCHQTNDLIPKEKRDLTPNHDTESSYTSNYIKNTKRIKNNTKSVTQPRTLKKDKWLNLEAYIIQSNKTDKQSIQFKKQNKINKDHSKKDERQISNNIIDSLKTIWGEERKKEIIESYTRKKCICYGLLNEKSYLPEKSSAFNLTGNSNKDKINNHAIDIAELSTIKINDISMNNNENSKTNLMRNNKKSYTQKEEEINCIKKIQNQWRFYKNKILSNPFLKTFQFSNEEYTDQSLKDFAKNSSNNSDQIEKKIFDIINNQSNQDFHIDSNNNNSYSNPEELGNLNNKNVYNKININTKSNLENHKNETNGLRKINKQQVLKKMNSQELSEITNNTEDYSNGCVISIPLQLKIPCKNFSIDKSRSNSYNNPHDINCLIDQPQFKKNYSNNINKNYEFPCKDINEDSNIICYKKNIHRLNISSNDLNKKNDTLSNYPNKKENVFDEKIQHKFDYQSDNLQEINNSSQIQTKNDTSSNYPFIKENNLNQKTRNVFDYHSEENNNSSQIRINNDTSSNYSFNKPEIALNEKTLNEFDYLSEKKNNSHKLQTEDDTLSKHSFKKPEIALNEKILNEFDYQSDYLKEINNSSQIQTKDDTSSNYPFIKENNLNQKTRNEFNYQSDNLKEINNSSQIQTKDDTSSNFPFIRENVLNEKTLNEFDYQYNNLQEINNSSQIQTKDETSSNYLFIKENVLNEKTLNEFDYKTDNLKEINNSSQIQTKDDTSSNYPNKKAENVLNQNTLNENDYQSDNLHEINNSSQIQTKDETSSNFPFIKKNVLNEKTLNEYDYQYNNLQEINNSSQIQTKEEIIRNTNLQESRMKSNKILLDNMNTENSSSNPNNIDLLISDNVNLFIKTTKEINEDKEKIIERSTNKKSENYSLIFNRQFTDKIYNQQVIIRQRSNKNIKITNEIHDKYEKIKIKSIISKEIDYGEENFKIESIDDEKNKQTKIYFLPKELNLGSFINDELINEKSNDLVFESKQETIKTNDYDRMKLKYIQLKNKLKRHRIEDCLKFEILSNNK